MLLQSQEKDCGKCVVRNLLSDFYHDKGFYTTPLSSECKDFSEIREELSLFGIHYRSYHVDDIASIPKSAYPLICQMVDGNRLHFVIVESIGKNKVYLSDPAYGTYSLSVTEFLTYFSGNMMAHISHEKKKKAMRNRLLRTSEIILYSLCFVLESVALSSLLIFASSENAFLFCIVSALLFSLMIILQNSLNYYVRHRLENDLILSSQERCLGKEDFGVLYSLITLTVKNASDTVSYAVFCVGLCLTLLLSSFYLCVLIVVGAFFFVIRLPLSDEKNAVNRFCTLKEELYLNLGNSEDGKRAFCQMRKRSEILLSCYVISYLLEAFSVAFFSFTIMKMTDIFTISALLYSIMLAMTFSYSLKKTFGLLKYPEEKARKINSLHFPFSGRE